MPTVARSREMRTTTCRSGASTLVMGRAPVRASRRSATASLERRATNCVLRSWALVPWASMAKVARLGGAPPRRCARGRRARRHLASMRAEHQPPRAMQGATTGTRGRHRRARRQRPPVLEGRTCGVPRERSSSASSCSNPSGAGGKEFHGMPLVVGIGATSYQQLCECSSWHRRPASARPHCVRTAKMPHSPPMRALQPFAARRTAMPLAIIRACM